MMDDDTTKKNPPEPLPPRRHTTSGRSRVDTTGLPFLVVYGLSSASACVAETGKHKNVAARVFEL